MKHILKYAFQDLKKYFTYSRYRPKTGYIDCYCSALGKPFGSGKTVSAINRIYEIIDKYNGSHNVSISVYTNISLNLPCKVVYIQSLQVFVDQVEATKSENQFNILFLDELAAEFNNRSFASNFTSDFLAKLVTCRHYNTLVIYTAQNFYMVDKVFRDLTTHVYTCKKLWRFFFHKKYIPQDMEILNNAQYIKPISRDLFFATDELFNRYDTMAAFRSMKKAIDNKAYKTQDEISSQYSNDALYVPNVGRRKRQTISGFSKF